MNKDIIMIHLNEKHAKEICQWKYADEYAIYNMPSWCEMESSGYSLTIEDKRNKEYKAFVSKDGELLAMCRYIDTENEIIIGIGVNPKHISKGIGKIVVNEFTIWLRTNFPSKKIYLEVRSWNKRAINCYEKCGYIITHEFVRNTLLGSVEFYRLYYND